VSERPPQAGGAGREILFEFIQVGAQIRVAAVDAATGVEAIVMVPANAMRMDMERLALRKLMRMLEGENDGDPEAPKGPGTIA
jgi:hypothetical protein